MERAKLGNPPSGKPEIRATPPDGTGPADGGPPKRPTLDAIMPALYAELRRMAAGWMRKERQDHTLQPTALVHEAYLRLARQHEIDWSNRAQVLGIAGRMMRRVLADYATGHNAAKRLGRVSRVAIEDAAALVPAGPDRGIGFIDLDRALTCLEKIDPQMASIVELRFFGGLTIDEVSEVTGLSTATVEREWATARVWLSRQIDGKGTP